MGLEPGSSGYESQLLSLLALWSCLDNLNVLILIFIVSKMSLILTLLYKFVRFLALSIQSERPKMGND